MPSLDFLRSLFKQKNTPQNSKSPNPSPVKTFASYEQAILECNKVGYEDSDVVDVVFKKTRTYRDALLRQEIPVFTGGMTQSLGGLLLVARTLENGSALNVLDFGGACGSLYFSIRSILGGDVKIKWHVVDTPAMIERARELETHELRFFDGIPAAVNAFDDILHLFHSSGSI